jgi:lysozyme
MQKLKQQPPEAVQMAVNKVKEQLRKDEGTEPKAYRDKEGVLTIGVGFNLEKASAVQDLLAVGVPEADIAAVMSEQGKALTPEQMEGLFDISFNRASSIARSFTPDFHTLPSKVQETVTNMAFQLGRTKLAKFKEFRKALVNKDFKKAGEEIMNSTMAKEQTPERSKRFADAVSSEHVEPPKTLVAEKVDFKKQKAEELHQSRVHELAKHISRNAMVTKLANKITESNEAKAEEENVAQEEQKPKQKVEKLEVGLFQDEAGGLFEVDSDSKIHSLDADGQRQESTNG